MSYEPTNWKAGDTVTSAKLNKIENGFSIVAPFIIEATRDDGTLSLTTSVTYNDIMTVLSQGRIIMLHVCEDNQYHDIYYLYYAVSYDDSYYVSFFHNQGGISLTSNNVNDSLVIDMVDDYGSPVAPGPLPTV